MLLEILSEGKKPKITTSIMSKKDIEENGMFKYTRNDGECDAYGIFVNGKWAGMINLDHANGSVQWLYIAEKYRGKGLGLLHKLFNIAISHNKDILRVQKSNTKAIKAYDRLGLEKISSDNKSILYKIKGELK